MNLNDLKPIEVPDGTPGVYFALLPTSEVKVGVSKDIPKRLESTELRGAKLLAVSPGWQGPEADLKARFRPFRSRSGSGGLASEIYKQAPELVKTIFDIRKRGFTPAQLRSGAWKSIRTWLRFDDGQELILVMTYLHVTEAGEFAPYHILERVCPECGETRASLQFLTRFEVEPVGNKRPTPGVVLYHEDPCNVCKPITLPASVAFKGKRTYMRIGILRDSADQYVLGYDRDTGLWTELRDFGIRRMSKVFIPGYANHVRTLRLQPGTERKGKAQGR